MKTSEEIEELIKKVMEKPSNKKFNAFIQIQKENIKELEEVLNKEKESKKKNSEKLSLNILYEVLESLEPYKIGKVNFMPVVIKWESVFGDSEDEEKFFIGYYPAFKYKFHDYSKYCNEYYLHINIERLLNKEDEDTAKSRCLLCRHNFPYKYEMLKYKLPKQFLPKERKLNK